jgi:hypothetical protein
LIGDDASAIATPVVAFGMNASRSLGARRNVASASRARSISVCQSSTKNCIGAASSRSRHASAASITSSGQPPNEPWLR